jgi:hypothetical protein
MKEELTMRVTFDTNVWNRMVFPERYTNRPNHLALVKIKDAIRNGRVHGFISEGFATVESIKKQDRASFHLQNIPEVKVTSKPAGPGLHCLTIEIEAKHDLHPGLTPEFEEELNEALAIGVKLLTTPYIGLPVPNRLRDNPIIYAQEVFATSDYNERFGEVVRTINDRGVGEGTLPVLAKKLTTDLDGPRPDWMTDRDLIYRVYLYACTSGLSSYKDQIEKAFAESADGDLVAAHIAFSNDYLCTEDRAKFAVSPSIFDANNRAWLNSEYGTKILSAQQLADLL